MKTKHITSDLIRQKLIERAEAHAKRYGLSFSGMSKEAVNDSKFLAEVKNGRNFRIESFQRVMDWIEADEAARKASVAA